MKAARQRWLPQIALHRPSNGGLQNDARRAPVHGLLQGMAQGKFVQPIRRHTGEGRYPVRLSNWSFNILIRWTNLDTGLRR
ncbi:hypothetical protein, partial [Propionivibrio sp.]|uniref:hypothetical protein n=1 Tax=Propionivibrio sp. TaxID=2212460 RepID=UPI003BF23BE5